MLVQILLKTLMLFLILPQAQQGSAQPVPGEAAFNRAIELQQRNQWPEAAAARRDFLKLEPRHAGAHANLGAVLARLGQYEESVKSYDNALRLNPQLTPALFNLGVAHYRAGQFAIAAEAFSRYLAAKPDAWQGRQMLGLALACGSNSPAPINRADAARTPRENLPKRSDSRIRELRKNAKAQSRKSCDRFSKK